ncbi:hypothetical protein [Polaromonas sp.]|uniref:hypothetical protein n=1 Tax=Polaromonas sp. TaxID=1869339 RepID=UPI00286C4E60|nr:hypothetical protein [Polaromonas sp.]
MKPNLRSLRNCDEPARRAAFHSAAHELACGNYTAALLEAWAPRQYTATQWAERIRSNPLFIAEIDGCIAGYTDLPTSGYLDPFSSRDLCGARYRRRCFSLGEPGATIQYCNTQGAKPP